LAPQPLDAIDDLSVRPHPSRPALEGMQHLACRGAGARVILRIAVDAVTVGPVAFDGDEREPFLTDQPLRELGAPGVILGRAMRCLAEQDIARVADAI